MKKSAPTQPMRLFGLIGYPLGHSFSKQYFSDKFLAEGIPDARYELFPLENISLLKDILAAHPDLRGLNVTIPYKQQVIPLLDQLDPDARKIGAVNVIDIRDGQLIGYNTDAFGFMESLRRCFEQEELDLPGDIQALVLGTGGASKAVGAMLDNMGIPFRRVSRQASGDTLAYADLNKRMMQEHRLIINTTPLGTYPETQGKPDIPYAFLSSRHILYDLVYNPPLTAFLQEGKERGCILINGLDMLYLQAEKAWEIWTGKSSDIIRKP
ncbi:MAG: shikimate dehydrogenase [Saprospiraceae bacterium]|nr:shikimate dehydrogenase [Saprospiraceae bacterium]MDP4998090.1 shikimate dehydrogenase [Saprospiraceae bacterium]